MKNLTKVIAFAFLTCCITNISAQDNDKVDKANKKVDKAQQKLDKAEDNADNVYKKEWKDFQRETQQKIENNEKRIKDLRNHKTSDASQQSVYDKKIDKLEAENDQLKKDLKDYDYNGKDDWQDFKKSVNKRIDKLSDAIDVATE